MGRAGRNRIFFRGIEYSPLPSQKAFHQSQARFKGFSGPIGTGKSQALCPRGDPADVSECGAAGTDRRADVSDAARCDDGGAVRDIERQ